MFEIYSLFLRAGEFGVVYRGHLTGWRGGTEQGLVAVKTIKGILTTTYTSQFELMSDSTSGKILYI